MAVKIEVSLCYLTYYSKLHIQRNLKSVVQEVSCRKCPEVEKKIIVNQ